MTKEQLESQIKTNTFGKTICYKETINSTNIEAKRLAQLGEPHGLLVIAKEQTMGKGRCGRSWSSEKESGIFMSLLLKPDFLPEKASMLTLLTALSVVEVIREETNLEAWIKWPNDIVVNGKKVCGILTEMSAEENQIHYVIVGIGINVNNEQFPEEIRKIATSLRIETKTKLKRTPFVVKILEKLEQYYELFLQTDDLEFCLQQYNEMLINRDKQVKIVDVNETFTGIAKGINAKGELLVQVEQELVKIRSGEVSVRGIYGYV